MVAPTLEVDKEMLLPARVMVGAATVEAKRYTVLLADLVTPLLVTEQVRVMVKSVAGSELTVIWPVDAFTDAFVPPPSRVHVPEVTFVVLGAEVCRALLYQ